MDRVEECEAALSQSREAVAYIGDGSKWSVSRRPICFGALPKGLRTAQIASRSEPGQQRRLMRQPPRKAVVRRISSSFLLAGESGSAKGPSWPVPDVKAGRKVPRLCRSK